MDKYFKGSSDQVELYPNDTSEFLNWVAPKEVQEKIEATILSVFEAENESQRLLERAKRAVELAIEEGEEMALAWLDAQV